MEKNSRKEFYIELGKLAECWQQTQRAGRDDSSL
jgi:hypothetical protein